MWWAEAIAAVGSAMQRFRIHSALKFPPIFLGPVYTEDYDLEDWKRTCPHSEVYVVVRNDTGDTIDVFVHEVMPMRQVFKLGAQAAVKATAAAVAVPLGLALRFAQREDKLQYTPSVSAGRNVYAYVGYFSGGAYIMARPPNSKKYVYCLDVRVPAGKRVRITPGVG